MNGSEQMAFNLNGAEPAIVLLAGMLFLSLVIERLLEIINSYYSYLEGKHGWYAWWNRSAEKIQRRLEDLEQNPGKHNSSSRLSFARIKIEGIGYLRGFAISVEAMRSSTIKYVAKCVGIALGIGIAFVADIDIFCLIDSVIYESDACPSRFPFPAKIATGVAMGLGAGPLHKIIAALERAKKRRTATG